MAFVVDASIAAAWILPDEHSPAAEALMPRSPATPAHVPSLFWHEMRSVALMAERRGRIAEGQAIGALARLRRLPLEDAEDERDEAVLALAVKHALSAYDAAYLALAIAEALPLATLDRKLATAARLEGVAVRGPLESAP
jgi:predicted nucleic acid-binding protein